MTASFIPLSEIIDGVLLNYYVSDVHRLSCQIFSSSGESMLSAGEIANVPKISPRHLKELGAGPLPIDIPGGRAAGIFTKGELVGYAVVSAQGEQQSLAADFVFELVNFSVARFLQVEDLAFTAEYLKNMISLMQRLTQKTSAVFDLAKVAEIFVQECEKVFGASAGAVLAHDGKKFTMLSSFGVPFADHKIAQQISETRKMYLSNKPAVEPPYAGRPAETIPQNVLALPLLAGQDFVGMLYLRDKQTGPFGVEDQRMAQTMSAVLGSTLGNINLHRNLVENERVRSTLSRYLSPNLVQELVATGRFDAMGGRRVEAAVLFADIRGFTKVSEELAPEHIVKQLNEYFEDMVNIIFSHDGTLDKYVGDLVMVLFGVPKPMPDAALRAVKTAIEMQKRSKRLQDEWTALSPKAPHVLRGGIGIGINFGEVIFGNIGSSKAMGLTVIGDNVNRAQRLEAYATGSQIIITESVEKAIQGSGIKTSKIGLVEVKGKQIVAYQVDY